MDLHWTDAAEAASAAAGNAGIVIVPEGMVTKTSRAVTYGNVDQLSLSDLALTTAVVLHKGQLDRAASPRFLALAALMTPVHANAVFVVLARRGAPLAQSEPHLTSLIGQASQTRAAGREGNRSSPSVYLGDGIVLAVLHTGDKIFLDGSDISLTPHLAMGDVWEDWITNVFRNLIRPGMTVVDIGCNCGYFTLLACRGVGESGKVHAIDANPRMADLVGRSVMVNGFSGRAKVHACAITDREGEIDLQVPRKFKGSSSIVLSQESLAQFGDVFDTIRVPQTRLSTIISGPVDVLKIDAEGAEPLILQGCREIIRNSPGIRIIMEFAPTLFSPFMTKEDFMAMIRNDLGLRVSLIQHDGSTTEADDAAVFSGAYADLLLQQ